MHVLAAGNGAAISKKKAMNTLPLIRAHIKRADRIHNAQVIATSHGSKFQDQKALNANSASRKGKAKRLHNAQLMAI